MPAAKNKAIVLLSAGLDSLTALALAKTEYQIVLALTFDYGQKAARQETKNAKKIARFYKIPHQIIKLPWFAKIIQTSLVNKKSHLPQLKTATAGDLKTAVAVWVPNRNGLFINIAAAFAESLKAQTIITGFNLEEAATFPDNSLDFCQAADKFFSYSTLNKVKVKNYFFRQKKTAILAQAIKLKAPLQSLWSCYSGKNKFCGQCESCVRLKRAIIENNLLKNLTAKYPSYQGLL